MQHIAFGLSPCIEEKKKGLCLNVHIIIFINASATFSTFKVLLFRSFCGLGGREMYTFKKQGVFFTMVFLLCYIYIFCIYLWSSSKTHCGYTIRYQSNLLIVYVGSCSCIIKILYWLLYRIPITGCNKQTCQALSGTFHAVYYGHTHASLCLVQK